MRDSVFVHAAVIIVAALTLPATGAAENNGRFTKHAGSATVARIIIGLRREGGTAAGRPVGGDRVQALAVRVNMRFRAAREIGPTMRVVDLEAPVSGAELDDTLARIAADPDVAFAEPDERVYRHAIPNDTLFPNQWYLQDQQASAINATSAWDTTEGSAGIVVAVLDTGVRYDHPDLGARLLPGRDFVGPDPSGGFLLANDGDGWDADASDPGDWITDAEAATSLFAGCEVADSSWHGTRVVGLIGAVTDNNAGIAGTTWATPILPVRVLGKCFGYRSDILEGLRWAAGLPVTGVPDNPNPAKVINMSLGSSGSCTSSYRTVLEEITSVGALVVASAGNSDGPVDQPGNCPGVVAVTGLRHIGTKVGFSSFGAEVALGAPGGNCVNLSGACLYSLDTTYDLGITGPSAPSYTDQFNINVGTSFSAPFVTAIAALMQSVNGNLSPPYLIARLKEGARPFPPAPEGLPTCRVGAASTDYGCACTTSTCGAGMADAPGSVAAALRPIADIAMPAGISAGQDVALDGSGSTAADGRTITAYSWTAVCGTPAIFGGDSPTATITAPTSGSVTLRLTVTDDADREDSADVTVRSGSATLASAETSATCPSPSGGGAWGWMDMLILAVGAALGAIKKNRG